MNRVQQRLLRGWFYALAILAAPAQDYAFAEPSWDEPTRRAQVVAQVGEAKLTVGLLEDQIATEPPQLYTHNSNSALEKKVDEWIRFELLVAEARQRGLEKKSVIVQKTNEHVVQLFLEKAVFAPLATKPITDADIQKFANAHKELYLRPETVRVSHILLKDVALAQKLLRELASKDVAAFAAAARTHSVDQETNLRGGDLRYFTATGEVIGQGPGVEIEIARAAFKLNTLGELIKAPVAVGKFWSVIKLTGRRPAQTLSQPEVAESVRQALEMERQKETLRSQKQKLMHHYKVQIHGELLDSIDLNSAVVGQKNRGLLSQSSKKSN